MTDGDDIIGDVHGCAGKLEQLLHTMGYAEVDGAWKRPTRQAVFVGDFIDRGPEQLRSVASLRRCFPLAMRWQLIASSTQPL